MDSELEKILNRRSNYLEDWENQLQQQGAAEADMQIIEYERKLEQEKEYRERGVPLTSKELESVLKARRSLETEEYIHDSAANSDVEVAKIDDRASSLTHTHSLEVEASRPKLTKQDRFSASPSFRGDDSRASSGSDRGILRKVKTFDVGPSVDPELASVLKLRRQKGKSDEEDEDDVRKGRSVSFCLIS